MLVVIVNTAAVTKRPIQSFTTVITYNPMITHYIFTLLPIDINNITNISLARPRFHIKYDTRNQHLGYVLRKICAPDNML